MPVLALNSEWISKMITETYFYDLVKELFLEYLPKVKSSERKEFAAALLDELQSNGFEFEDEPVADDYSYKENYNKGLLEDD